MIQNYRNYDVQYEAATGLHIARPNDENDQFCLTSFSKTRLFRGIDQLWEHCNQLGDCDPEIIDAKPFPGWIRNWAKGGYGPDRIDLDREEAAGQL